MRKIGTTILLLILSACSSGGGSSGTGTITIQGNLRTTSGEAISSAKVKITGYDENSITDSQGAFTLNVPSEEGEDGLIPLEVESEGKVSMVDLKTDSQAASNVTIRVEIHLDPSDQLLVVDQVDVEATIVGTCDLYFENGSTIRQSNKTPTKGINCTLKVSIFGDGKPLTDVPFVIEYTGCSETKAWHVLAAGETRSAPTPGVGQLEFKFLDDSQYCTYRVIAPFELKGVEPVITKIHTFTKQKYDQKVDN